MVSLNVTFYLFFYKKKKPIIICRFFKNLQKKQKHAEPKKLQCRYFNYLQKKSPRTIVRAIVKKTIIRNYLQIKSRNYWVLYKDNECGIWIAVPSLIQEHGVSALPTHLRFCIWRGCISNDLDKRKAGALYAIRPRYAATSPFSFLLICKILRWKAW